MYKTTLVTTVEQLRSLRADKIPMWRVVYLPYIEGKDPQTGESWPVCTRSGEHRGHCEDIYTDRHEAEQRFDLLNTSTDDVETDTLELFEVRYPLGGGRANILLREGAQTPVEEVL